jgi:hypothetical protein
MRVVRYLTLCVLLYNLPRLESYLTSIDLSDARFRLIGAALIWVWTGGGRRWLWTEEHRAAD